jgi:trk system potassium uptake protein TrkH
LICFRYLGRYFFYFSLVLLIPFSLSLFQDFSTSWPFAWTLLIAIFLWLFFSFLGKKARGEIYRRESIFLVGSIWFLSAAVAALPFLFSKTITSPLDAYFEAMSGLTTTGASILDPHTIETIPMPILFWRSFLQWLGGMGIVLLFITVLPGLAGGGKFLFEAEVTGPTKESMRPRIKETARLLWKLYLGLTALEVVLLLLCNPSLSFFDALTLSFSCLSTGGFSAKNGGLEAYNLGGAKWIVILFMILGSINFSLYFQCLKGKIYRLYEPEFFAFIGTLIGGSLLVFLTLLSSLPPLQAFQAGVFQAISSQTSTGFSLNEHLWPFSTQFVLLLLVFVGGMSGSTSGGIKIARFYILFRVLVNKIESIFRPSSVRCLKIGTKEISDKTALTVLIFFCIMILFTLLGTFLLILDGFEGKTALSVIASMINNSGISLGLVGQTGSYAFLPPLSKIVSILWMALGRLEFFVLLVFLFPSFWRGK